MKGSTEGPLRVKRGGSWVDPAGVPKGAATRRCKVGVNQRGAKGGAKLGWVKGIAMHALWTRWGVQRCKAGVNQRDAKGRTGSAFRGCQGLEGGVASGVQSRAAGGCNGRSRRRVNREGCVKGVQRGCRRAHGQRSSRCAPCCARARR